MPTLSRRERGLIGLAVGGVMYLAAVVTTALVLIVLAGLKPIENRFFLHRRTRLLTLTVERRVNSLYAIEAAIEAVGLRLERVVVEPGYAPEEDRMNLVLSRPRRETLDTLIDSLRQLTGVRQITSVRTLSSDDASTDQSPPALDDDTEAE